MGEIIRFQTKGRVLIQGDLNARINTENDTIEPDKYDERLGISFTDIPCRNSQDHGEVNVRGVELLNLCKSLNMVILNGRKTGDVFGKYTSIHWNGKAVVDYAIVPADMFEHVSSFTVGNYAPFISDHCPIFYNIITNNLGRVTPEPSLEEVPKSFRLSQDDQTKS